MSEFIILSILIAIVVGVTIFATKEYFNKKEQSKKELIHLSQTLRELLSKSDFQIVGQSGVNGLKVDFSYLFYADDSLYSFKRREKYDGAYTFYLYKYLNNTDVGKALEGEGYVDDSDTIKAKAHITVGRLFRKYVPKDIKRSPMFRYLDSLYENFQQSIKYQNILQTGPSSRDIPSRQKPVGWDQWTK